MAMYEGQALQVAQSMAADVENIRKKLQGTKIAATVDITPRSAEIAISERLDGKWSHYIFDVSDGIAKTKDREITDRKGRVIA